MEKVERIDHSKLDDKTLKQFKKSFRLAVDKVEETNKKEEKLNILEKEINKHLANPKAISLVNEVAGLECESTNEVNKVNKRVKEKDGRKLSKFLLSKKK